MDNERVEQIIDRYPDDAGSLIQVLLEIQRENRWLPGYALERVSRKLNVPLNRVQNIVTFYKAFSLIPKGRHEIQVCTGTACHVRGASRLLDSVEEITGIRPGETGGDYRFSLETVGCVGCCALGPVVVIDGEYHGKMEPARSGEVLKRYI